LIDDSHGAGVICINGRGTPEFLNLSRERIIQTTTLSKAFGCFGGAILASKEICDTVEKESFAISGSTPFPLPCAAAAITATRLLKNNDLRARLRENLERVTTQVGTRAQPGPIIPVIPKDEEHKQRLTCALLAKGIFPSHIQYQNGPAQGYFRFAISSEHSRAQLDALAAALTEGA
jgi:7-keto-8-aminopelargonate synthetase-like enzyme